MKMRSFFCFGNIPLPLRTQPGRAVKPLSLVAPVLGLVQWKVPISLVRRSMGNKLVISCPKDIGQVNLPKSINSYKTQSPILSDIPIYRMVSMLT
jgi:hypothetical protein